MTAGGPRAAHDDCALWSAVIEFAIVGMGSWGLCVLERTVSRARQVATPITVHLIEPGQLGGGVYSVDQPDYLVMNNACGQLSLFASPVDQGDRPYAIGLYDWAVTEGYRWHGYECRRDRGGVPIAPGDYLPRRLMGEYLLWCYRELVADAPPNLDIVPHFAAALDIEAQVGGREAVSLDDGTTIVVDHVIITSGHTYNIEGDRDRGDLRSLRPYPVGYLNDTVPDDAPVAIAGMGLVGYDMLTAFTIGRAGAFSGDGDRLRYVRSGHEPKIYLYSRSGIPYCAKSVQGIDPTGDYQPVVCTSEAFAALTKSEDGTERRRVDFSKDLLPLVFAEMQARYLIHSANVVGGTERAAQERSRLGAAWAQGRFDQVVEELSAHYGHFDPASHLFANLDNHLASGGDYQSGVYAMLAADLDESLAVGGSPVKAAQEVLRILRDQLRSVIEFGGLTLESYIDFQSRVRGRINRIDAGPPPMRSQQLLALVDAGVVEIPFGPHPDVQSGGDGRIVVRSTQLDTPSAVTVMGVVRGHLELPSLARSDSPLLKRLYAVGRLTQLRYGATAVGSVAISPGFHPYDAEGRLQPHLSLLGVLTEGVRYFTHYLPSPRSRMRAVLDAERCVHEVVG